MTTKTRQQEASHRQKRDTPPARPCADPTCRGWVVPGQKCGFCKTLQPALPKPEVIQ